jgi:hypothetical protein
MEHSNVEGRNDFELVGMIVPGEPGRDHLEEMAETLIIEFIRMGWSDDRMLALFRNPFYQGPHSVCQQRGEEYVRTLIERLRQR